LEPYIPTIIAALGSVIGLLLFYLVKVLISSQRRAERLVHERTRELREKSEVLSRTNLELERSNKDLERFVEIASHDLQEPLRTIRSYSQILQEEQPNLNEDSRELLAQIIDGSKRMKTLLEDVLEFARLGRYGLNVSQVDCQELVGRVLKDLTALIDRTGASVEVDVLPTVQTSPLLEQVFRNLLVNAMTYHGDEPPKVRVSALSNEGYWSFRVDDNGIGIKKEYRKRIFGLFERLHGREKYDGSGLGLAICQRIVDELNGTISVEESDLGGSRFVVRLPLARESTSTEA
jgi:light-regulated signal transduction histidine kinase (bacteriophytochrome)